MQPVFFIDIPTTVRPLTAEELNDDLLKDFICKEIEPMTCQWLVLEAWLSTEEHRILDIFPVCLC